MKTANSFREVKSAPQRSGTLPERFSLAIPMLLFSLFTLPLIINPVITESFDPVFLTPKVFWIYAVILPALLLLLNNWKFEWGIFSRPIIGLTMLFCAWLLVSSLANRTGWAGWWGQADRADGVLMHFIYILSLLCGYVWVINDRNWGSPFFKAVILGGSVLALSGVLQQLQLVGVPNANALTGVSATPYGGTLGNRGYMGGAMALLLPIALWSFKFPLRIDSRLHLLAAVLMSWAWAGSLARAALLAGILAFLYLVVTRQWSRQATLAVLCGVVLWGMTLLIPGNASALSSKVDAGLSGSGRTVLWNSAIYGVVQRPLLGWGTPALIKAVNARPAEELLSESGFKDLKKIERVRALNESEFPSFKIIQNDGKAQRIVIGKVDKVHNEYLDYALTYGIPALLLFSFLLGSAIWSGHRVLNGVAAGIIGYSVYIFLWPEIIRFSPIAWFCMGIALAGQAVAPAQDRKLRP